MLTQEAENPAAGGSLPLLAAADLQDHLMVASNDLDRLQRLLADACRRLIERGVLRRSVSTEFRRAWYVLVLDQWFTALD